MGFSYFCFLIHCNQWTPLIALFLVFPFLRNIFWLIVNRVGGSGMDLRSKARVISFFFSYVLILVLFDCFRLFWCFSLDFFFFLSWNRPFLDQLAILQSFPNGTMMVLALAKLRGKTVKLFYSMLLPSFSLSLSLSLSLPPSPSFFLPLSLSVSVCVLLFWVDLYISFCGFNFSL